MSTQEAKPSETNDVTPAAQFVPRGFNVRADKEREVYFIRSVTVGLIKIGVANRAKTRLLDLRSYSADALDLIGVVRCQNFGALERELHLRFAADRSHGEWFRPSAALLAYIAENAVPAREPKHMSVLQRRLRNAKRRSAASLKAARGIT